MDSSMESDHEPARVFHPANRRPHLWPRPLPTRHPTTSAKVIPRMRRPPPPNSPHHVNATATTAIATTHLRLPQLRCLNRDNSTAFTTTALPQPRCPQLHQIESRSANAFSTTASQPNLENEEKRAVHFSYLITKRCTRPFFEYGRTSQNTSM